MEATEPKIKPHQFAGTYTYDADGNRVEKSNGSTGTLYWYMSPGIVGESDLSGNLTAEYVFFDGERVARKDLPGGAVSYYFSDHLKTTDIVTDAQGNIKNESDFYPWGGELQFLANDSNHYKFTGKERDSETQLDYFGARYYSNGLGRWTSPDKPFADQHLKNPQSWNLYMYAANRPTSLIDTDGREVVALTSLAQQRIQSTVPKEVRAQVAAAFDNNGKLSPGAINAIKSTDSNVQFLKEAVNAKPTIEVTTAPAMQGGQPKELVGMPFSYESAAEVQAKAKAAGDPNPSDLGATVYDGVTQTANQSPSGNIRVTVADGTGQTATEPEADLASVAAHELYGHALLNAQGKPYEHDTTKNGAYDPNGPVNKRIDAIVEHTKELNK